MSSITQFPPLSFQYGTPLKRILEVAETKTPRLPFIKPIHPAGKSVLPIEYTKTSGHTLLRNRCIVELFLGKINAIPEVKMRALLYELESKGLLQYCKPFFEQYEWMKNELENTCLTTVKKANDHVSILADSILEYFTAEDFEQITAATNFLCLFFKLHDLFFPLENFVLSKTEFISNQIASLKLFIAAKNLFHSLENLDLSDSPITMIPLELLSCLKNLKTLKCNRLTSEKITEGLEQIPSLKKLELQSNGLRFFPLSLFENLPQLKVLNLSNNRIPLAEEIHIRSICAQKSIRLSILNQQLIRSVSQKV